MMFRHLVILLAASSSFAAEAPSFRNTIQPILTRYGCAMGACHGAAAGQGGFRLSLRGFDDEGDWLSITRSANGRRLTLEDPARSLFLLKAVKAVPHKGDKRFEVNSPEYKAIVDWIAAGAPGPKADDPRIVSLSVSEPHLVSQAGKSVQLKVTAKFSDGHSEDVTRWCKYNATNASVATVDDTGLIKITGAGEGTVSAWYLSLLSVTNVVVPKPGKPDIEAFAALKPRNVRVSLLEVAGTAAELRHNAQRVAGGGQLHLPLFGQAAVHVAVVQVGGLQAGEGEKKNVKAQQKVKQI